LQTFLQISQNIFASAYFGLKNRVESTISVVLDFIAAQPSNAIGGRCQANVFYRLGGKAQTRIRAALRQQNAR